MSAGRLLVSAESFEFLFLGAVDTGVRFIGLAIDGADLGDDALIAFPYGVEDRGFGAQVAQAT
jgi:hypothetical protein